MIRRPPRSTLDRSSAASDVYKRQLQVALHNSARSVILLTVAVAFVAWLGWQGGHGWSAGMMVVMGLGLSLIHL